MSYYRAQSIATVEPAAPHGAPVMARHENGEMYAAHYRGVNAATGLHSVAWKDGGEVEDSNHVVPTLPLKLSNIRVGSEIEANWTEAGEHYGTYGATVEGVNGTRLSVRWHNDNTVTTINFNTVEAIYGATRNPERVEPDEITKAEHGSDADKLAYLKNLWTELNRTKFGGHMHIPRIKFFRNLAIQNMRGRGLWQSGSRTITINRRLFNKPGAVYETFLHEMCHQAVSEIDRVNETINGGHGPHWTAWMRRVGLDPRRFDPTENVDYMNADEKLDMMKRRAEMDTRAATPEQLVPGTVVELYRSNRDKTTTGVIACQARSQKAVAWSAGAAVWAVWIPGKTKYSFAKIGDLFIAADQSVGKTDEAKLGIHNIQSHQGYKDLANPLAEPTKELSAKIFRVLYSLTMQAVPDASKFEVGLQPSVSFDRLVHTLRLNRITYSPTLFNLAVSNIVNAHLADLIIGIDGSETKFRGCNRIKLTNSAIKLLESHQ